MNHYTIGSRDLAAFVLGALFFFGCIVGSQRSAKTLQPGQASIGTGISHLRSTEDADDEPVNLIDANLQVGVAKGIELGIRHTQDITSDNDAMFSALWGDAKFQLNNYTNELNKPTFAVGLSKGYIYHEDAALHITSIPITVSTDVSKRTTLFAQYRHELISDDFFPSESESFEKPRNVFVLGSEFALSEPAATKWAPKVNLSFGLQNPLAGGDLEINSFSINAGIWFDSPFSNPKKIEQ